MDAIARQIFRNRTMNAARAEQSGAEAKDGAYVWQMPLCDGQFLLTVRASKAGEIATQVIDTDTNEPYTLFAVESAAGGFVGAVRTAYEQALQSIADACFDAATFGSVGAADVIEYARTVYGDELEFLWGKFPDNAVLRRKDTQKWYAALLTVSARKLGLDCDDAVEVLDVRVPPQEVESRVDGKSVFYAYHMNKKHWITLLLDGSVPSRELHRYIDVSYTLATK